MPSAVIWTILLNSSAVGLRAIWRTRPYFPFPIRFARSSIRFWISQDFSTIFVAIYRTTSTPTCVVLLALPEPDHRDAAAAHDRLDVVEVEVHEPGLRDDLRDPLDPAHQDVVRDLECLVQREPGHELDQFVVRDDDHRVGEVPEPLEPELRILPSHDAFRAERPRA